MKEMLTVYAVSKICLTARVLLDSSINQAGDEAGTTVEEWPLMATLSACNKFHAVEHK